MLEFNFVERELIIRRFWKEDTLKEIAKNYGLSRETVRKMESEAIRHLKGRLNW